MWVWEECVLFCCCWNVLYMYDRSIQSMAQVYYFFLDDLSGWSVTESGVLKSLLLCIALFLASDLYLLNIFRCSDVVCTGIYNCYILLMKWPFYHYRLTFFIPCYSLLYLNPLKPGQVPRASHLFSLGWCPEMLKSVSLFPIPESWWLSAFVH